MSKPRFKIKSLPDLSGATTALFPISMGNPMQTGARLKAAIEWAEEHFGSITIDIGDTLNRHNLVAEGHPPEQALVMARAAGDAWLRENAEIISAIKIPYCVRRWDEHLNEEGVRQRIAQLRALYALDEVFQAAMNTDIDRFAEKKGRITKAFKEASRAYLLEELAVDMTDFKEPTASLYPGPALACYGIHPFMRRVHYRV